MNHSSMLKKPKAILFDMDGVLVDSEALHWQSVELLLHSHLGVSPPYLEPRVGWGDHALWREFIIQFSLSGTPESLTNERGQIAMELLRKTPPPQMKDAMVALILWKKYDPNLKLAVVSASPKEQMIQSLTDYKDETDLSLFDLIISGVDDVTENKPHPAPYLRAMNLLEVTPKECWIAEDSSTGLTAGIASGANVFAVGAHTVEQKLLSKCQKEMSTLLDLFHLWQSLK